MVWELILGQARTDVFIYGKWTYSALDRRDLLGEEEGSVSLLTFVGSQGHRQVRSLRQPARGKRVSGSLMSSVTMQDSAETDLH